MYIIIYMEKPVRDSTFVVRLSKDELKSLKREALERNMSAAEIVRQAVKIYIDTYNMKEEKNDF